MFFSENKPTFHVSTALFRLPFASMLQLGENAEVESGKRIQGFLQPSQC
jgi:hypothetical protein